MQINIPHDVNEKLKIIKAKRKDTTIQETTIYVLNKYIPQEEKYGSQ